MIVEGVIWRHLDIILIFSSAWGILTILDKDCNELISATLTLILFLYEISQNIITNNEIYQRYV